MQRNPLRLRLKRRQSRGRGWIGAGWRDDIRSCAKLIRLAYFTISRSVVAPFTWPLTVTILWTHFSYGFLPLYPPSSIRMPNEHEKARKVQYKLTLFVGKGGVLYGVRVWGYEKQGIWLYTAGWWRSFIVIRMTVIGPPVYENEIMFVDHESFEWIRHVRWKVWIPVLGRLN